MISVFLFANLFFWGNSQEIQIDSFSRELARVNAPLGEALPDAYFHKSLSPVLEKGYGYYAELKFSVSQSDIRFSLKNLRADGNPYPVTFSLIFPDGNIENYLANFAASSFLQANLSPALIELAQQRASADIHEVITLLVYSDFPFAGEYFKGNKTLPLEVYPPSSESLLSQQTKPKAVETLSSCCGEETNGFLRVKVGNAYSSLLVYRWLYAYSVGNISSTFKYRGELTVYYGGIQLHVPQRSSECRFLDYTTSSDQCPMPIGSYYTLGNQNDPNYYTIWDNISYLIQNNGDGFAFRPAGYAGGPFTYVVENAE